MEEDLKQCSECKEYLPLSKFQLRSDTGKYRNMCKECNRIKRKDYKREWAKKDREKKPEYYKQKFNEWHELNKEYRKEYRKNLYEKNIEHYKEYEKKYRLKNKEKINKNKLKYQNRKYKTDELYHLKIRYRNIIRKAFKRFGYSKNTQSFKILRL